MRPRAIQQNKIGSLPWLKRANVSIQPNRRAGIEDFGVISLNTPRRRVQNPRSAHDGEHVIDGIVASETNRDSELAHQAHVWHSVENIHALDGGMRDSRLPFAEESQFMIGCQHGMRDDEMPADDTDLRQSLDRPPSEHGQAEFNFFTIARGMNMELAAGAPSEVRSHAQIGLREGCEARCADAAGDERSASGRIAGEESFRPVEFPLGFAFPDLEPGALAALRIKRGMLELLVGPPDHDVRSDAGF